MSYFVQCAKKAINIPNVVTSLINDIFGILKNFTLHNTVDEEFNEPIRAYHYGSTCQTYILEKNNIIIKQYNQKLRWTSANHNDSDEIFNREISILKQNILLHLYSYNQETKTLKMQYCGESLYNHFNLPKDWQQQIKNIFDKLTNNNIFYPEFALKNILILNNQITLIDYGLSSINTISNTENCNKFIDYLTILNNKLSNTSNRETIHQLYSTFTQNMKITN
jgi:hypothetical protein